MTKHELQVLCLLGLSNFEHNTISVASAVKLFAASINDVVFENCETCMQILPTTPAPGLYLHHVRIQIIQIFDFVVLTLPELDMK